MTNHVILEGNITREPEARVNDFGSTMWSATLAVPEARWDSKEQREVIYTNWIYITARGETADRLVRENVGKSCKLLVRGKLGTYFKEKAGAKETKTQVEIQGFDILRRPSTQNNQPSQNQGQGGWGAPQQETNGGWGNPADNPSAGWGN